MKKLTTTTFRFLLAILFLATSLGKLLDNRGFAEVLQTYQLFPSFTLMPLALAISLSEFTLGIFTLLNKKIKFCSKAILFINSLYLALAIVSNLRGLNIPNCGCFGVFLARPMTWNTVIEDAILVLVSLVFLFQRSNTEGPYKNASNAS